MGKTADRFRNMKRQEKVMLLFIVLLIVAIITRWGYIKGELAESFRHRFAPRERTEESIRLQTEAVMKKQADTLPAAEDDIPAEGEIPAEVQE